MVQKVDDLEPRGLPPEVDGVFVSVNVDRFVESRDRHGREGVSVSRNDAQSAAYFLARFASLCERLVSAEDPEGEDAERDQLEADFDAARDLARRLKSLSQ